MPEAKKPKRVALLVLRRDALMLVKYTDRAPPLYWKFPKWTPKSETADDIEVVAATLKYQYGVPAQRNRFKSLKVLETPKYLLSFILIRVSDPELVLIERASKRRSMQAIFVRIDELQHLANFREADRLVVIEALAERS